jgi:xylose isomerase
VRGPGAQGDPTVDTPSTDAYTPTPDDHFTFGLWTVGNTGRDPFGHEVRPPLDPVVAVHRLAELGAYGVNFHDDDLVPPGSSAQQREAILKRFRQALDDTGMKVPMATTNLFSRPVFKEGAFTANDPRVRRLAVAKTFDAIDLGVELGASVYVMWGGREGVEAEAAKDVRLALDRYAEAVNLCCAHARDRGYELRFALEPKPNEPRGDLLLPTVGHALAFIGELEWPEMVGLNPEFAHETMSGLNVTHAVAQCLWHGKLFHLDLNAQRIGKYDQDFRFGSEGVRDAFYLVKLLEDAGWDGMRHFDAHAYRVEDADGVWDFARGCMRTYLILREKAARFAADPEIAEALATARVAALAEPTSPGGLGPDALAELRGADHRAGDEGEADGEAGHGEAGLASRGYGHERLDQLVTELLLGVR